MVSVHVELLEHHPKVHHLRGYRHQPTIYRRVASRGPEMPWGYEWLKLINLGHIRDDIQLFTSTWETVTGSYLSLSSPEFPQALLKNLFVLLGDTSC
jgi:hypothetical protein